MVKETDPEEQDGVRLEKPIEPGHSCSLEVILKSNQEETVSRLHLRNITLCLCVVWRVNWSRQFTPGGNREPKEEGAWKEPQ